MKKPTRPPRAERRRAAKQPPILQQPAKWWTPFRKAVAFVVGLIAFISALLSFLPRVSVDMAQSTDPNNEFALVTTIQNTGYVPIEDMQVAMGLCELDTYPTSPRMRETTSACKGSLTSRLTRGDPWHVDHLAMDEKFSLTLGDLLSIKPPVKISNADISIVLHYRPAYWPFHYEKEYGYKSQYRDDGTLVWFSVPR